MNYRAGVAGRPLDEYNWVELMLLAQRDDLDAPVSQAPMRPLSTPLGSVLVRTPNARLTVPATRDKGDAFYSSVAEVYRDLAAASRAPASAIADANGVPATTVHRWIREARKRGFLPPARAGKAG